MKQMGLKLGYIEHGSILDAASTMLTGVLKIVQPSKGSEPPKTISLGIRYWRREPPSSMQSISGEQTSSQPVTS